MGILQLINLKKSMAKNLRGQRNSYIEFDMLQREIVELEHIYEAAVRHGDGNAAYLNVAYYPLAHLVTPKNLITIKDIENLVTLKDEFEEERKAVWTPEKVRIRRKPTREIQTAKPRDT